MSHILIKGSEGSLGIVTKLALHCPTASKSINLAFLGLESYQKVMDTYLLAKRELGEILSSVEMIDDLSLESTKIINLQLSIIVLNLLLLNFMITDHQ